ncbi:hypothetical protein TNIN_397591 [Trichonephila inaurata madagascariensis]|uniref:Uncharacterized protein n=1 Tax=Trichonephila inaurata madagascariensis TaxID=2747483 RepID=A0A8X6M9N2_9ARAC|nr:hypothetical protein TNIN_397591 [Trichonephila inaurata madagascariensis]
MIQNPTLNIVECIEGLDNLKKYLVSRRPDDNFKIYVDSVTTLARDLGIDDKFSSRSSGKESIYLFMKAVGERDEPAPNSFQQFAISSANGRFS